MRFIFLPIAIGALVLSGCVSGSDPDAYEEECPRSEYLKGAMMSSCSFSSYRRMQTEVDREALAAAGRGAITVAKVAAPVALAAATPGAAPAAGASRVAGAGARLIAQQLLE